LHPIWGNEFRRHPEAAAQRPSKGGFDTEKSAFSDPISLSCDSD
jgi:hypothetical protein